MKIEYRVKETEERNWCELTFVDFPKAEAEREEKHARAHTVILTPLSLPDLRVMEV